MTGQLTSETVINGDVGKILDRKLPGGEAGREQTKVLAVLKSKRPDIVLYPTGRAGITVVIKPSTIWLVALKQMPLPE